ncbi:MAG: site-specific DNA-methyltransferase [Chloroflexi bacterium]|nr:site-specific DNA-methyltransferase [Chloroflexota bacterium]
MPELADDSVDLTVTSPPYWNAIDYDAHARDASQNYRPRQKEDYDAYLEFLKRVFTETFRVHKPGSHCAIVIGTVLLNGKHVPVPYHVTTLMEEIGWEFHQDVIWAKVTGGVKRAGATIQNPYPGYYYPNLMLEYILIFRKPGNARIYSSRAKEEKLRDAMELDAVFTRDIANNIWHIAPVPPNQLPHPCPFPEEIAYRLIRLYSYTGDLVLDPFAGIGTTLKVAHATGRNWVGYELKNEYIDVANKRVNEHLKLRKQLIADFVKVEYGEKMPAKNKARAPFRRIKASKEQ